MEHLWPEMLGGAIAGFVAFAISNVGALFARPRPAAASTASVAMPTPEHHVHHWRVTSREWTNGKHVRIKVCADHEVPVIEREEVEAAD